jgi:hypothetical protein
MGFQGVVPRKISKLLYLQDLFLGFDPAIRRFESFHPSQFVIWVYVVLSEQRIRFSVHLRVRR